jgi:hypothetical protein
MMKFGGSQYADERCRLPVSIFGEAEFSKSNSKFILRPGGIMELHKLK